MPTRRILVVDDDPEMLLLVGRRLREDGYEVRQASTGTDALTKALGERFDLIVLDLMLPEMGGLEVCRALRTKGRWVPILMLTAKGSELDRVGGLEVGADDYVTKPFAIRELLARIHAIFRRVEAARSQVADGPQVVDTRGLRIDFDKRTVTVEGRAVGLTAKEFELLALLARSPGRVYSREQLLDLVWGYQHGGSGHTVNSHINRLRAKIEPDSANPRFLETVHGVGYRFCDVS